MVYHWMSQWMPMLGIPEAQTVNESKQVNKFIAEFLIRKGTTMN